MPRKNEISFYAPGMRFDSNVKKYNIPGKNVPETGYKKTAQKSYFKPFTKKASKNSKKLRFYTNENHLLRGILLFFLKFWSNRILGA